MKKNKRLLKTISTMALAMVMGTQVALSVFAEGEITGTENSPAQAAITKMLEMPEGTITPTADFTFTITKKSYMEETTQDALGKMPAIDNVTISFTDSDNGSTDSSAAIKSVPIEAILNPVFTDAGVYTYEITENADTYTIADSDRETMNYSQGKYEITYYVKAKSDGSGYYVEAIVAKIIKNDAGTEVTNEKVDPTPGGSTGTGYSDLMFTNTYFKNNGGVDPTLPANQVAAISKTVAGTYADSSKYFSYDLMVTKPAVLANQVTYKAYVVEDNAVVTSAKNVATSSTASLKTDGAGEVYIEVTTGTVQEIKLKDGQKLVFNDLTVGAKYVAEEKGVMGYTPTAKLTVNGSVLSPDLSAGEGVNLSTETRLIGEGKNSADFTNTFRQITPTGVIINNFPFVMIIVAAAAAFIAFVAVKSRRRNSYTSGN